jgi:hypothetical protein
MLHKARCTVAHTTATVSRSAAERAIDLAKRDKDSNWESLTAKKGSTGKWSESAAAKAAKGGGR